MEKLLTAKDAAERIKCSESNIYRLIDMRKITFIKLCGSYRFTKAMIDDYIQRRK